MIGVNLSGTLKLLCVQASYLDRRVGVNLSGTLKLLCVQAARLDRRELDYRYIPVYKQILG